MATKKAGKQDGLSIEEAFLLIDEKIEKLEDDEVSLEDAFTGFREGMELVRYCEKAVEKIEKKVMQITEDGEMTPFE